MARVLVVALGPEVAGWLTGTEHDVADVRPDELERSIATRQGIDVLVLDLDTPELGLAAVRVARASGATAPMLLLSSDRARWNAADLRTVSAGQARLLPRDRATLQVALQLSLDAHGMNAASPSGVPRTRHSLRLPNLSSESAVLDFDDRRRPEAPPEVPSAHAGRVLHRFRRRHDVVELTTSEQLAPTDPADTAPSVLELVRQLSDRAAELYSVPETALAIVSDAVERTRAHAGAILVPDSPGPPYQLWRVAGGMGLRPLEGRYELDDGAWLIQQVVTGDKGLLIEDTDIVREQLRGAPLASWRHLLAAPLAAVASVLVLARRDDPPFSEHDLAALAGLTVEAGPRLDAAMAARTRARDLSELRDEGGG